MENARNSHRSRGAVGPQHSSDAWDDPSGGDHSRERRGQTALGGNRCVNPNVKTGAHHHGELETVLYIVKGRARFRWGNHLEFVEEAGPGDFIYVPPYVPHQEINARRDEPVEAVVVRSGQEPVVINLDIESPEPGPDAPGPFHPSEDHY